MPGGDSIGQSDAVEVLNPQGAGAVLLLCEHASNHIPARYGDLGLEPAARDSHAVWDPGARAVALALSEALDAPLVASRVSRLVYDCNRPPEAPDAMPATSERFDIPGNRDLSPADRQERIAQVYDPFCAAVSGVIAARQAAGTPTALVTMHSFTPVYFGTPRAVEIGILHDEDSRLADTMLANAAHLSHRRIERNEPYGPADGVTHSLRLHGLAHGLANVMLEIRNDLLTTATDQATLAEEVLSLLTPALAALPLERVGHA